MQIPEYLLVDTGYSGNLFGEQCGLETVHESEEVVKSFVSLIVLPVRPSMSEDERLFLCPSNSAGK